MTSQVILRPLAGEDKARLLAWRNSPEVASFMYTPHRITQEEHDRWWSGIPGARDRRYWIICNDDQPVGLVNLYDMHSEHLRAGWAFYVADPAMRGRGIGSCVGHLVLGHVFEQMAYRKLCCEVLATNPATIALHASTGFQVEGVLRGHIAKDGVRVDVIVMAVMAEAWPQIRERLAEKVAERGLVGRLIEAVSAG